MVGGLTSLLSGYIGMIIAVYTNARTATMCQVSWTKGFNVAFRAGSVMGFALTSIGLLIIYVIIEPEYFDLTGRRVTNPGPGIYIRRHGRLAEKIVLR